MANMESMKWALRSLVFRVGDRNSGVLGKCLYRVTRTFSMVHLSARNVISNRQIVASEADVVVNLTSFGPRVERVFLAIESVGRGKLLPSRIILWLDESTHLDNPVKSLRRLEARGLEIRLCENLGPHKKYYPYVALDGLDATCPFVTIDDDAMYPRWWLHELVGAHSNSPDAITCYRAKRMQLSSYGVREYASWPTVDSIEGSMSHVPTGVSGVLYPASFGRVVAKFDKSAAQKLAPFSDDLWLHWCAVSHGYQIFQVRDKSFLFWELPGTDQGGLAIENVLRGRNDRVIESLYSPEDLALILAEAKSSWLGDR
ncbi:hypothetical protein [Gordonia sputi]